MSTNEPSSIASAVPVPRVPDASTLVQFAASILPTMRLPSGTYCFDRDWRSLAQRGDSLRYTLMVALGCQRAATNGYAVPDRTSTLIDAVLAREDELTPGDLGLALWALSREGDGRAARFVDQLSAVPDPLTLSLAGMETAWIVIGASAALKAEVAGAGPLLERSLATMRSRRAAKSPLFRHTGGHGGRASFPNFATQVYSLLALADVAMLGVDGGAIGQARALADLLVESRDADHGWPWLFHAERGSVVERYEVYSVHQDAMAPMAFFALAEATGDDGYARVGAEGLPWCFGHNDLGFLFYDAPNEFAHRSIKRRGIADRVGLWGNTVLAATGTKRRLDPHTLEVNTTCRPYHLGWIMEAWAGREAHARALSP